MAGNAGIGRRHATSYHSVYRAVWINDPALFADRAWYWRSAAVTAVFLYSLLPIVRNTHTALDSLPPGLREAGRGIGMTFWQRLRWVEIPMALPVIFGGIRTAVVMNIGVMAIAAVIGAGGLGLLLLNGISGSDIRMLIAGALMICLLAIVLDWLLHRLQVVLTPKGIR